MNMLVRCTVATGFIALISTVLCVDVEPLDFFGQLWHVGNGNHFNPAENTENNPLTLRLGTELVASVYSNGVSVMVKPEVEKYPDMRFVLVSGDVGKQDVHKAPGGKSPADFQWKGKSPQAIASPPSLGNHNFMVHAVLPKNPRHNVDILVLNDAMPFKMVEKTWFFGKGNPFSPKEHTEETPLTLWLGVRKIASVYKKDSQVWVNHEYKAAEHLRFVLVSGKGAERVVYRMPGGHEPAQYVRNGETVAMANLPSESDNLMVHGVWPQNEEWRICNFEDHPSSQG